MQTSVCDTSAEKAVLADATKCNLRQQYCIAQLSDQPEHALCWSREPLTSCSMLVMASMARDAVSNSPSS